MSEREIGFAVVGLGMGAGHARDIYDLEGARLVAVCDLDEERLKAVGSKFKAKRYKSFARMLANPDVEVVSIALPSGMHAKFGIRAARAGKHVVIEKPIDVKLRAIDRLIAEARKANVKLGAVFQSRYSPLNRRIKEVIDSGRMGKLYGIHADLHWWREQSYYGDEKHGLWKGTWAMDGGGSLANQGIHTLDLVQWLAGPAKSVFAYMDIFAHQIETEDKCSAVLRFENGAIGTINTTTACWPGGGDTLTIYGENGTIATGKKRDTIEIWKFRYDPEGKEEQEIKSMYGPVDDGEKRVNTDPRATSLHGHQPIMADMIEAIRQDRDPFITGESARRPVEIMTAIYKSARTGREVKLPL